jgi:SAM-dependent methyltransferase
LREVEQLVRLDRVADSTEDLKAWDSVAATYATQVGVDGDTVYQRFEPFLWQHLGDDLTGQRVLDSGCGHGWLSALIAARGAEVVGVDGSTALVEIARHDHPTLTFEVVDLVEGLPAHLEAPTFDRVLAHMVVMDLPELDRLGESLARCVDPTGVVALTLLHPAFFMQRPVEDVEGGDHHRKVRGYLQHEERWVESFGGHRHYHRPLGFYVDWMVRHGFALVELFEPPVPLAKPEAEWTDYDHWFTQIPTMVGLAFRPLR